MLIKNIFSCEKAGHVVAVLGIAKCTDKFKSCMFSLLKFFDTWMKKKLKFY